MPKVHKVEGFVLKKRILLEKDYLVSVYTRELGKITAIAKGARKITSRRAAHLQTGNLLNIQLSDSHGTFYVQSSELISGFLQIRTQDKLNFLYLYLYILDKIMPEGQSEFDIYNSTKRFFIALSKDEKKPALILKETLQNTLMILGYIEEELSLNDLLTEVEKNIEEKLPLHVIM